MNGFAGSIRFAIARHISQSMSRARMRFHAGARECEPEEGRPSRLPGQSSASLSNRGPSSKEPRSSRLNTDPAYAIRPERIIRQHNRSMSDITPSFAGGEDCQWTGETATVHELGDLSVLVC